jgi:hypothetical protein
VSLQLAGLLNCIAWQMQQLQKRQQQETAAAAVVKPGSVMQQQQQLGLPAMQLGSKCGMHYVI